MKLNISYPANGTQKLIEIEDERKLRVFMDRRMGAEVAADSVGPEFAGYVFKITGGNDKQGFPMKQGIMHPTRVRLLLSEGHSCFRPRRTGERKRKSVRGCIVAMDLSVLAVSVVKQGDGELPGLTDTVHPKRLGPKRATRIRRFFKLGKDDDVSFTVTLWKIRLSADGNDYPVEILHSSKLLETQPEICFHVAGVALLTHLQTSRSANSSFAAKYSPKPRARNHIPKHRASSAS